MTMTTDTELDAQVGEIARRLTDGRRGAVVVGAVRDDACEFAGADPGTVFEIGSVSKTFTALALARLAVRGGVSLDQPLSELLPPGTAVPERGGRRIELGQLACHTSGLPRLPAGMMPRSLIPPPDPYADCTPESLLAGLARTRLRSVPGRRYHYSNLGAGLLGLALARHTGRDYDALIRSEICEPLGLADTRVVLDDDRTERLAQGHSRTGRPRPRWRMGALAGAGGLHSTAPDLLKFALAQLGDAPGSLTQAIALTHETSHRVGHAMAVHPGWIGLRLKARDGGHHVLFHNGGTGGYRSFLAVAPERQAAVVVLSATARSVDRAGLELLVRLIRSAPPDEHTRPVRISG
ncbi:serine hydrolase domain-containing protein [Streptomyces litchfieldiae]|uniref:Beta-lactamase n=1 Tax=Streptomyces litchfieldiae TaxID=3075543 RepID=A0ABU2MRV2_9ACTN|nr:serine hydrolase domain-containing protein [Streptomyces sp. DSM 44938]MDT0344359.1 serine hydrolase domain-containing protein [Streptomyces sp. DSM 44938]